MLFESLSWVLLTFMLIFALPGALASPSPKRMKKAATTRVDPEVYPALEEDLPMLASAPPAKKKDVRVQTLGASTPTTPVITPATKFEIVPAEKRPQILARMQLCQSLFEATGRAYDYRTMTTAELESELAAVRSGDAVARQEAEPN